MAQSPAEIADQTDLHYEISDDDGRSYREWHAEVVETFKADLARTYLPTLPTDVTDVAFRMAWDHGHASGYGQVQDFYEEFADLAKRVEQAVQAR